MFLWMLIREAISKKSIPTGLSLIKMEINAGFPDDRTIQLALGNMFKSLGRYLTMNDSKVYLPMTFPLKLKLETETFMWDFKIIARLQNAIGSGDDIQMDFKPKETSGG